MIDFRSDRSLSEAEIVQNPALGAYCIWKFGEKYYENRGSDPSLLFSFLVLPLVLHRPTLEKITSTQRNSGMGLFAAKLGEKREEILSIHERVNDLRNLTLYSIAFATRARIISVNYPDGTSHSNTIGIDDPKLPERLKRFRPACEKLGLWFSSVGLSQVATSLRVNF